MTDKHASIEAEMGYPLSPVLREYDDRLPDMNPRITCRHCPLGEWIVEFVANEYGDHATARAFCAAHGGQSYPRFAVRACDARIKAIEAERLKDEANSGS